MLAEIRPGGLWAIAGKPDLSVCLCSDDGSVISLLAANLAGGRFAIKVNDFYAFFPIVLLPA
jgi:hypothetical protein